MGIIYLDNNATTPCDPRVVEAMAPYMTECFGNADSPHALGRSAAHAIAESREMVASLAGCDASEIIFTSGATESNNLAVLGAYDRQQRRLGGVVTSAVEHKSVLEPCRYLEECGIPVATLPVSPNGRIDPVSLQDALRLPVRLVSIQVANNETGIIQPIADVARAAHRQDAIMHSDAAQALGKIPFSVHEFGLDCASFSAHKVYGPKGVGALFVHSRAIGNGLSPLMFGGTQELGVRPGTLNVPGIVGFGAACRIAATRLAKEMEEIRELRDYLEAMILCAVPDAHVNASNSERLPGTLSIMFPGVPADVLIANVPNVCLSNGSACTSGTVGPSHVLVAMGLSPDAANCTVRMSVGRNNTKEDVTSAAAQIALAVARIRTQTR